MKIYIPVHLFKWLVNLPVISASCGELVEREDGKKASKKKKYKKLKEY